MGRAEGVLFSLVASFCASMGLVLQKHSHNMKEWDNSSCQWRWWIGLVFVCVGGLFDSMALLNAPLIDIAPLTSVTVLLNALLSNFFLGEYVGPIEICATIVIFLGATTTCIFGASDMGTHDLWQLIDMFGRRTFTIYISIVCLITCVTCMVLWYSHRNLNREGQRKLDPLLYGIISAMIGGIQVVLLKCIAEIGSQSYHTGNMELFAQHPGLWALVGVFAVVAVAQLVVLNLGLRRCHAVHVLPIYQAFLIVVGVCGGGAYFNEFRNFTFEQIVSFVGGCCLVFLGTMLLACRPGTIEDALPPIEEILLKTEEPQVSLQEPLVESELRQSDEYMTV